jgi:hypothetical protein
MEFVSGIRDGLEVQVVTGWIKRGKLRNYAVN